MRLFSGTAFLTVSRNSEDSSPKRIRPLQSTTRIPSLVRVANVSFIGTLLCGLHQTPLEPDRSRTTVTHQPIGCRAVLASFLPAISRPPYVVTNTGYLGEHGQGSVFDVSVS